MLLNPQVLVYRNKIFSVLEGGGARFRRSSIPDLYLTTASWQAQTHRREHTPELPDFSSELEKMTKAQVRFVLSTFHSLFPSECMIKMVQCVLIKIKICPKISLGHNLNIRTN